MKITRIKANGFTLIEIVLVMAIISILATATVTYSAPVFMNLACTEEKEVFLIALGRARHLAQVFNESDVSLRVTDLGFEVETQSVGNHESILVDRFLISRTPTVSPASFNFFPGNGFMETEVNISVGNVEIGCEESFSIQVTGVTSQGL